MKGDINVDHIPVNKYTFAVVGLLDLTVTECTGLDDELQTTELPDRTRASGGNRGPTEFDITIPAHHLSEQLAMEAWYKESQDPVLPSYKKPCTLTLKSISGAKSYGLSLMGVFPMKRVTPDLDMANEGELAGIVWSMSADDVIIIAASSLSQ